ncbi:hypothetical protein MFTT_03900 [Mycolicibacterium fortuitum subsp. fortuitum]|nr:hypothetical protein MFTT_03900 [Mycolicibacterium fortuitum subsp. fortuitum]
MINAMEFSNFTVLVSLSLRACALEGLIAALNVALRVGAWSSQSATVRPRCSDVRHSDGPKRS